MKLVLTQINGQWEMCAQHSGELVKFETSKVTLKPGAEPVAIIEAPFVIGDDCVIK